MSAEDRGERMALPLTGDCADYGDRVGRRLMLASVAGLAVLLGWAEVIHWRASWRRLGQVDYSVGREAVVVLGVRNRGDRANYLNRFRVRAGVRSMNPTAREGVLVLCGGAVAGHETEADLMARYARDELGYDGPIRLDRHSQSTWENIQNAIPLIEEAEVIKVVSDSLHAERGRADHPGDPHHHTASAHRPGADHRPRHHC
jgi:hypothetical protein